MVTRIYNIKSILTWNPQKNNLLEIKNPEILLLNDKIIEINTKVENAENNIDANNNILTPGFIDSHTHPIFVGNRSKEFLLRASGKTYQEIATQGGGIVSSIKGVRQSSFDDLYDLSKINVKNIYKNGTTLLEAKSGYGLTFNDEIKSLEVIKLLNNNLPIEIIATFLGAHAFPIEYLNNKDEYVRIICEEMIPKIAEQKLAEFCDVFCEKGYFDVIQSRKILETAKSYGLIPRLHADEFIDSGAAELAADINAISADHLMAVSNKGIQALSDSNVIATLLPGTTLFLGKNEYVNGRKLIESGIEVALATDFNPGSCTINSIPVIMSLAVLYCGLSIEEAFKAVTWNSAKALNREKTNGLISNGYQADFIFWDIDSIDEIPYWFGTDRIKKIFKSGLEIYSGNKIWLISITISNTFTTVSSFIFPQLQLLLFIIQ